jgi:hypothetical protein
MEDSRMPKRVVREQIYTYERWGLKDGEGKLRVETSGGE